MCGHVAGLLVSGQNVVQQQSTHLVARDGLERAVRGSGHDAHAVCVGIGCHDQVAANAVGDLNTQLKYLRILGVGLGNGGEVAVNDHLLGNGVEVLKTNALHHLGHQLVTRAVQRGVDNGKIVRNCLDRVGIDCLRHYLLKILFIGLLAQHDNQAVGKSLVKVSQLDVLENVQCLHGCADRVRMLGGQLCAILPVCLVAVVFLGVVGSGDVNARYTAVFAQREGKLGGGAQIVKEVGLDACCSQYLCGGLGKESGIVAAVVCDSNAVCRATLGKDQIGKTLGCVCYRVNVHGVHTGLHIAAQACRAKGEVRGKAQTDFTVVVGNGAQLSLLCLGKLVALQPTLVILHVLFHDAFSLL